MTTEIPYLSYSSISTYLSCAEAWRRRYVLKERTPQTPALLFGSAFHDTIEACVVEDAQDMQPIEAWRRCWAAQVEEAADNITWQGETPDKLLNDGIRMFGDPEVMATLRSLTYHSDDQGPFIERKVELMVPGVPVPIVGYVDMLSPSLIPMDFKTSNKRWTQDKAQAEIQPLFYLAALNQLGIPLRDGKFKHYVFVKTQKPQVQVLEHAHSPAELFWLFDLIGRVWRAIEAEAFPLNPTSWRCSAEWCEYWHSCRGRR